MAITYSNKTGPSRKYFMNLPLGVRPTIGLSVQDRLLLAPANCLIQDLIDLDAPPNFYLWIIKKWYQKILQYDVELYLIITDMFCEIAGPVDVAPLNFTTPSSSPLSAYTAVFPRPNNTDWGSYGNTTGYFYGWACPIYNPITSAVVILSYLLLAVCYLPSLSILMGG